MKNSVIGGKIFLYQIVEKIGNGERVNDASELYNLIQKQLKSLGHKKLISKKMKKIYEVYAKILNKTDKGITNMYFKNEEIKEAIFKWSKVKE